MMVTKLNEDDLAVLDGRYVAYRELHGILDEQADKTSKSIMRQLGPSLKAIEADIKDQADICKEARGSCTTGPTIPSKLSATQWGVIGGGATGGIAGILTLIYLIARLMGINI